MKPSAWLFYGEAGAGKTAIGVSAFWDFRTRKLLRDGRLLLFGREENIALRVPEENIRRFVSPATNPLLFATEFKDYMQAAVAQGRKGKGPGVYVFDGFSEWNNLFIFGYEAQKGGEKWEKWAAAKDLFFSAVQMLNPNELNAWVIGTARVTEKRKGVYKKSGEVLVEPDPDYINFKYIPAMQGWAKENLAHYFSLVSYVEAVAGPVTTPSGKTRTGVHHRYYMLPVGDFLVKNCWDNDWLAADKPDYLTNPMFDDIVREIEGGVA